MTSKKPKYPPTSSWTHQNAGTRCEPLEDLSPLGVLKGLDRQEELDPWGAMREACLGAMEVDNGSKLRNSKK